MKKVIIKSGEEMMKALAPKGKLYGLKENLPADFNITEAGYPQTFIIDEESKSFTVEIKKPAKTETKVEVAKAKKFNWKKFWVVAGSVLGTIVVVAAIVCGIVFGIDNDDKEEVLDSVKVEASDDKGEVLDSTKVEASK